MPEQPRPAHGLPSAFMELVGLRLTEVGPDRVAGWLEVGPAHHQPHGIVHGGLYAAVVEEAASQGAHAAATRVGRSAVGVANVTNFLRPVAAGRLVVEGVPLHQGRTQQLWEVRITRADDGKLVAVGQLRA
ncbi:MAG TPA: PaaI family thioesterase, partial [Acidimicrobiales bacterium]|nr:PaaI family thioesterase [Acidimicrobiales bacterium]